MAIAKCQTPGTSLAASPRTHLDLWRLLFRENKRAEGREPKREKEGAKKKQGGLDIHIRGTEKVREMREFGRLTCHKNRPNGGGHAIRIVSIEAVGARIV